MIKVSFIVPVYNVEKYLKDCLESLLKQTIVEKEIIIINDGSTDNSLKIANQYADKNDCIKVYTKINGGLSSARNLGLEKSNGKYILFIDSDDIILDDKSIEDFYNLAENNNADIVKGKYIIFYENTKEKRKGTDFSYFSIVDKCVSTKDYFNKAIEENKYEVTAVLGLYKKKYLTINKIKFMENVKMEDHEFNIKVLIKGKGRIIQTDKEFYMYRKREGSITTFPKKEGILDILKICEELRNFLKTLNLDNQTEKNLKKAISTLFYQATSIYGRISEDDQNYIDKILNREIIKFSLKNAINLRQKLKFLLFLYNRPLVRTIYLKKRNF